MSTAYGQLSGSYTIDPGSSASSTNYKTFEAAVSDLNKGTRTDGGTANGAGVSGAVTFKIASGTYNERVRIASITGASSTNTITFVSNAGDSTKVILENTTLHDTATVILHGADYVTFQKITIKKADSTAIYLFNTAKHNRFLNNVITGKLTASTLSSGFQNQQYSTIASIGANNDSNLFQSNKITYGTNGLFLQTTSTGNKVMNNIIDSSGSSGVYALSQTHFVMEGNIVNSGAFASSASHYVSYGIRLESSRNFKIVKNKFYATSLATVSRCLVVFNGDTITGATRNIIANNFAWVSAGSSSSTGITIGGCKNCDIVYNNVLMTSTPTASAAMYYYAGYTVSSNIVKNNNLINMGNGYAIDNPGSYSLTSDYNNLFTKGTNIGQVGSTKYTSLSAWKTGTSLDANSVSVDPGYVSNMDLHVSSAAINGKGTPITGVTDDIDGQTRNTTTPDIGADEFTPLALDAGVTGLVNPVKYCAGTEDVEVRITNFGTDTLTKATINWTVNGVAQTAYSWTDTLTIGNVSDPITLGSISLTANTPYVLKIWTSSPNGGTDGKGTNDTLRLTINSALSGTYTIGGSSPDFANFNDALDALTLRGICSSTVFSVRNGTYNEQLIIPVFATSSSKTVTFQSASGDSSKVILSLASATATGSSNALLQLNGADYITFKQMTFMRTGTNDIAQVIDIKGGATNNKFLNNRIIGTKRTSAGTNGDMVTSTADGNLKDTANVFMNNHFKYGSSAIVFTGTTTVHENSNVIEGNIIDSTFATAINANYNDGIVIRNNTLRNILTATSNTSYSGILVSNSNGAVRVTGNKVMMPYGGFAGIQLSSNTGTSGSEGLVANNYVSIASGSATATPYGIYINGSPYQNVYFNSVEISKANAGAALNVSATGNVNVKNNILFNSGGGYAIQSNTTGLAVSNYNDLFSTGANVGRFGSTGYSNIAAWRTASKMDSNSVSVNPLFPSSTDYHTKSGALYRKGTAVAGVTTDIEGKTRNNPPSIGALEFNRLANDAGISSITSPVTGICQGVKDVIVSLTNSGGDTLKNVTINWSVNGTAQTAYSFSGKIKPDSTATITIGSFNFTTGSSVIKVYTSSPNNVTDSLPANDTATRSISASAPTANAGSDQIICSGKSVQIGASAVTGVTYSWTSNPSGFTSTSANPTVSPSATTTYIVEAKNASGCTRTDTVKVTVNSLPTSNAGNDQTICEGGSVQIGASATTGLTYSWTSNPSGFTSTSANPTVNPTASTTYTVETKNANGCTSTDDVTITVNALPKANAGTDMSICSGKSVQIGSTAVTGETYSWTSDPSGFTSSTADPSVSPTATTTYILEVTNANSCKKIDSVKITVNALPTPNAGSDQVICEGESVQIGASAVTGESYSWVSDIGSFTSTDAQPTVNPTATTVYTVEVTNANGCVSTDEVTVTVNNAPVADAGSDQAICEGDSIQIGTAAQAGDSYSWTATGGFTSTDAQPTVNPTVTTTYMLEVTNGDGCKSTDTVIVTVNTLPTANAGSDTAICNGGSVQIGTAGVTGVTYSWTSNPSGFTSVDAMPTVNPTVTTTYTLVATGTGACTSTDEITVTVNDLPTANAGNDTAVCEGNSVMLGSAAQTGESYSWTATGGFTSTDAQPTVTPTATTTYTLVVTNASGCTSTDEVIVTVNSLPVANAGTDTAVCDGNSVMIGTAAVTGNMYSWTGTGGFTSTDAQPTVTPALGVNVFYLVVTNTSGCTSSDSVVVGALLVPVANAGNDTAICEGKTATIGTAAQTGVTYSWTAAGGFTSTDAQPTINPTTTTTYTVEV
ncbi:MAG: Ig-like domain-containing protein, partial [Bacteroidia bacterium]